ncbi:MAG: hypothetical protein KAQ81_03570 [Deltaproteobacteria bacterium]|nr:hypothetical protein [Deltaproteobacteria bacterium]
MGTIEFSAGSFMYFTTGDNVRSDSGISLEWGDAKEFAKNLREVADWLDKHSEEDISVYVD